VRPGPSEWLGREAVDNRQVSALWSSRSPGRRRGEGWRGTGGGCGFHCPPRGGALVQPGAPEKGGSGGVGGGACIVDLEGTGKILERIVFQCNGWHMPVIYS
jgi:hypothetical protein